MGIVSLLFLVLIACTLAWILHHGAFHPTQVPRVRPSATPTAPTLAGAAAPQPPDNPDYKPHPFPVAHQSSNFEWAAADGKDTNVIRQLAHNEFEYRRMLIENNAIFSRQLVYLNQSLSRLAQQASQTGQSLKQITLPGLNGQELTVDVTRTDFRNDGSKGQIYGQLPGRPDSMVTAAFVGLREAFTIISPQDQIYLQAEAHEPNQVVVKSINPKTYGTFASGK